MLLTCGQNMKNAFKIQLLTASFVFISMLTGCASRTIFSDLDDPVVFKNSLESRISERFPLSEWGQTKTTLYEPTVELSHETGGVWVRLKGQTWNWEERRYRFSISMLTEPTLDSDKGIVRLMPTREIIWDLSEVPRIYKQQVMDMTYPILIDTFHDKGFSGVEFKRPLRYPQ